MKFQHLLAGMMAMALMMPTLTSCDSDDDPPYKINVFNKDCWSLPFNSEGAWTGWTTEGPFTVGTTYPLQLTLSHSYNANYQSWTGFTPANKFMYPSQYTEGFTDSYWPSNQWAVVLPDGINPLNEVQYFLAFWNSQEALTQPSENRTPITFDPSVRMRVNGAMTFTPVYIGINNSAVTYFTMLHGSSFSQPFDNNSYLKINVWGVREGMHTTTRPAEIYLARNGQMVNEWTLFSLSQLGNVEYIYFQMESSDTGAYGMNTPGYFCVNAFAYDLTAIAPYMD